MAYSAYPSSLPNKQSVPSRRYQIRQKIFSLGDSFTIKDEVGNDVYRVRSKLLSFGDKLAIEDMGGK